MIFFEIFYIVSFFVLSILAVNYLYITILFFKQGKKPHLENKWSVKQFYRSHSKNELPLVLTQVPIFNEKFVIERVIKAIVAIDYPKEKHEIQILDDSVDETLQITKKLVKRYQKQGFNIQQITRKNRTNYKAGALKHGLSLSKAEYISIFDADFLPPKNFLKHTLPHFQEKNIGMVQTRWSHLNDNDSFFTKAQSIIMDCHFVIEQSARYCSSFFFNFNGTAGIWRKKAIVSSGGWQGDTLTEDLDLSYRAQLAGWDMKYLPHLACKSEIPQHVIAYKAQQYRWANGSISTARKLLKQVWKSPFNLFKKIQATFHLFNYFFSVVTFAIAVASLPISISLYTSSSVFLSDALFEALRPTLLGSSIVTASVINLLTYVIFFMTPQTLLYRGSWIKKILRLPLMLIMGYGISVNNTLAVFQALFQKRKKNLEFVRTPKLGALASKAKDQHSSNYLSKKNATILFLEFLMFLYTGLASALFFGRGIYITAVFLALHSFGLGAFFILTLKNK